MSLPTALPRSTPLTEAVGALGAGAGVVVVGRVSLATGGSVAHLLAVDYALKPVLSALKAQEILHGVFADDSQVIDYQHKPQFTPNLQQRLDSAIDTFWL